MPSLDEILDKVGPAEALSKLDLAKRFRQLLLRPDCHDFTTFCSPYGKYRYKKLLFGLRIAPAHFQAVMDAPAHFQAAIEEALRSCRGICEVYIDDILVFSKKAVDHVRDVEKVLNALRQAGITAKPDKCSWGRKYLLYLGHRIGCGQVSVPQDRVRAFKEYRQPKTQKDRCAFLGAIRYYLKFVKHFVRYSSELTPVTFPNASRVVSWTEAMVGAFHSLCDALCNYVVLVVPHIADTYTVHVDASRKGLGASLLVIRNGE